MTSTIPHDHLTIDDVLYEVIHSPTGYWYHAFTQPHPIVMALTTKHSDNVMLSPARTPFPTASEYTAVDSPPPSIHYGTSHVSRPSTYVAPSPLYTGQHAHASLSPSEVSGIYGQPQQQYLPGAIAAVVPGDTRMQADPLSLITQALGEHITPEAPPTASPSSPPFEHSTTARKVKQPAKSRRRQDTIKRFTCPYRDCGKSMSAV